MRNIILGALLCAYLVGLGGCGGGAPTPFHDPGRPIVTLVASATGVYYDDEVTLTWTCTNATEVVESNFGATALTGSTTIRVHETTTFYLLVRGVDGGGYTRSEVTVTANYKPEAAIEFWYFPTVIHDGDKVTFAWNVYNAVTITSSLPPYEPSSPYFQSPGIVPAHGQYTMTYHTGKNVTYYMTAIDQHNTQTDAEVQLITMP